MSGAGKVKPAASPPGKFRRRNRGWWPATAIWSEPGWWTPKQASRGGYRLTRDPNQVSILQVIEAAEGPLRPERCAVGTRPWRWEQVWPLHETWADATTGLRTIFSDISLAEVAARDLAIAENEYPIAKDSHRAHPVAIDITDRAQVELGCAETHVALARVPSQLGYLLESADAHISLAPDSPKRRKAPPGPIWSPGCKPNPPEPAVSKAN
jgi:hypothetical protein